MGASLVSVRSVRMATSITVRVSNLRKLALEMRKHASETELPVYVELMLRTARQLEQEAVKLELHGPYGPLERAPNIRYVPSEH